mmetsp:Transcript_11794/g.36686  ORF Transcript_11794/g.36686 Transcript_11794/m.36686 type:complete len:259 (+) Transcript_11794:1493-2269(+)
MAPVASSASCPTPAESMMAGATMRNLSTIMIGAMCSASFRSTSYALNNSVASLPAKTDHSVSFTCSCCWRCLRWRSVSEVNGRNTRLTKCGGSGLDATEGSSAAFGLAGLRGDVVAPMSSKPSAFDAASVARRRRDDASSAERPLPPRPSSLETIAAFANDDSARRTACSGVKKSGSSARKRPLYRVSEKTSSIADSRARSCCSRYAGKPSPMMATASSAQYTVVAKFWSMRDQHPGNSHWKKGWHVAIMTEVCISGV